MKNIKRLLFSISTAAIIFSCAKYESSSTQEYWIDECFAIKIPQENLTLFADIGEYSINSAKTKSVSRESKTVTLESLLNRNKTVKKESNGTMYIQIPFQSNETDQFALVDSTLLTSGESCSFGFSVIKKFLICKRNAHGEADNFIATVIAEPDYLQTCHTDSISVLSLPNFTGIILFSQLDGTLEQVTMYNNGAVIEAELTTDISALDGNQYVKYFGTLSKSRPQTKIIDDESGKNNLNDTLDACYVVASPTPKRKEEKDLREPGLGGGVPGVSGMPAGPGSSGQSIQQEEKEDKIEYVYLTLATNDPNKGNVYPGSGTYTKGSRVLVSARPFSSYIFSYWAGDLSGLTSTVQIKSMNHDVTAEAYFREITADDEKLPCLDTLKGLQAPLNNLSLASANNAGTTLGATFGWTRTGGTRHHNGIDFYANVGTPIFAILSGKVVKTISSQPMRISIEQGKTKYPDYYDGDTDDAGNRIYIESTYNGRIIQLGYWHLDVGGAGIGKNPITGNFYKVGDNIPQGAIIGNSGRSGNALNVPNPHLHLAAYEIINGGRVKIDPAEFINGSLPELTDNSTDSKITGTKCHNDKMTVNEISIYRYRRLVRTNLSINSKTSPTFVVWNEIYSKA